MNADQMTFGIEIECFLPSDVVRRQGITVGHYHAGRQIPGLPTGWQAQHDGSLQTTLRNHTALEITSPVLRGAEGLQQVVTVVRQLQAWGIKTNRSCGLHVHIGGGFRQNLPALLRLVCLVAQFERALFALTGTKSREHNHYAGPVSEDYQRIRNATDWNVVRANANKYRSLNLKPLFESKQTVEFRVFQGTTNVRKIVGYIMLCLGLCERAHAMRRQAKWTNGDARYQNGAGLAYFLLRNLNWNPFARLGDKKYGVLLPEWLDRVKAEFKRLANKYDADTRSYHPALRPRR